MLEKQLLCFDCQQSANSFYGTQTESVEPKPCLQKPKLTCDFLLLVRKIYAATQPHTFFQYNLTWLFCSVQKVESIFPLFFHSSNFPMTQVEWMTIDYELKTRVNIQQPNPRSNWSGILSTSCMNFFFWEMLRHFLRAPSGAWASK